jgi:hypothetical protein
MGMYIHDETLERVRIDGYAVIEGFLDDDELTAARSALFNIFPRPDRYFADPNTHEQHVRHQFAGLHTGPLPSWDLNRIAFHPDLVDAAERFCDTSDLELYKIELWGKYSGGADYDQPHHRDFGNHSMVVPRRDRRWPQLTSFILLSDVTAHDGPTMVIPRATGDEVPFVPRELAMGELVDQEVAIVGPAGSILLYTTDVLHRGSTMTGSTSSRFSLLSDYSERGNPWMGKMSWPGLALQPGWHEMIERASARERDLFGFPAPGHEYWNDQTLADVQNRYPNMDMSPYLSA